MKPQVSSAVRRPIAPEEVSTAAVRGQYAAGKIGDSPANAYREEPGVAKGSTTVLIGFLPAARVGDMTMHATCVAPIPSLTGKIIPPCCPTVIIGG